MAEQTREYSDALTEYIGRTELLAARKSDGFDRYMCFFNALEKLASAGLSEEDSKLARNLLTKRVRETQPDNIGGASGEAGEAD